MSSSLKPGFSLPDAFINSRLRSSVAPCSSVGTLQFTDSDSKNSWGKTFDSSSLDPRGASNFSIRAPNLEPVHAQASITFGKSLRWWEKSPQPNMIDISLAQELIDSLLNAGDKLVIIDFYSPGCGGCKALHPKICQLAELNANALFLKVNYEEHRKMCHALHVHVLPFFRFYRGAEGRVCSFSCTNATIKKFKDALAKHGTDRCSIAPTRGLNESEILALASLGLISRNVSLPSAAEEEEEAVLVHTQHTYSEADVHRHSNATGLKESNDFVMAGN